MPININDGLSVDHITQFVNFWEMVNGVQLHLEAHKQWMLFIQIGLHDAILGSYHIDDAHLGVETLGTSKMQDFLLVDPSKLGLDGG